MITLLRTLLICCLILVPLYGCNWGDTDTPSTISVSDANTTSPLIEGDPLIDNDPLIEGKLTVTATATPLKNGIAITIADLSILKFGAPTTRTVSLAWDANTETDLAGYRLYYGDTPRPPTVTDPAYNTYTTVITIPDATAITYQLELPVGTYYFALIAYNTSLNESGFSNEVFADVLDAPQNFTVTFIWDNYTQSSVTDGFKIFYGPSSRGDMVFPSDPHPYTDIIIAPGSSLVTYTTDIPAGDYYFALTSYSESNPIGYQDSPFSNEVYASIPTSIDNYPQTPNSIIVIPIS